MDIVRVIMTTFRIHHHMNLMIPERANVIEVSYVYQISA